MIAARMLKIRQGEILLNRTVIIEVLSPRTEPYDRGDKFHHYREIESLQEILLTTQDSPRIEQYVRQPASEVWQYRAVHRLDSVLDLPLNRLSLRVGDGLQTD